MRIVWDEPKRLANLANRGLDFAALDLDFFVQASVEAARDHRLKAVGVFNDVYLTVIFKPLGGEAISIISMRRSNRKERNNYDRQNP